MRLVMAAMCAVALCAHSAARCAATDANRPAGHCCITELASWYGDPEDKIRKRFDIFRSIGVDTVRVEICWRESEPEPGKWQTDDVVRYLRLAKEYGFRIKVIMGVMMSPPKWYLDAHPDAMMTDSEGRHSIHTMSYWYPHLRSIIDRKTGELYDVFRKAGVTDLVDYVIPAFGPAGEPIYPALWTLGPGFTEQPFWGYDAAAQDDFRADMKRRYSKLAAANKAWKTSFPSWDDVCVPKPGTTTGQYWRDYLTWYRDSKREFIKWQIGNTRKHFGEKARILLYIPGTGYTDADFEDAVRTGSGNDPIRLMTDSRFMVDTGAAMGCWLQYTGSDNAPEVARLRQYIDSRGYPGLEMWGENYCEWEAARDPVFLADTVVKNRLYGLDYTHSRTVFEDDRVTPSPTMNELAKGFEMVKRYWAGMK